MRFGILLSFMLFSLSTLAQPTLLLVGDSLSAAYGFQPSASWVQLIQQKLDASCTPAPVIINASISGDRTENALARIPALLKEHKPDYVWIEMGSNDGLRGTRLTDMRASLAKIIELAQASGAKVALFDLMLPPNFGPAYTKGFNDVFESLAEEFNVILIPYLLLPVSEDAQYIQADNLHPTESAQPIMADYLWPSLKIAAGC